MRKLPPPKSNVDARGNRFGKNSKRLALQKFSAALDEGMTITDAVVAAGISRATYYRWIKSSGVMTGRPPSQDIGIQLNDVSVESDEHRNVALVETLIDDLTRSDATINQVRRAVVLFSLWLSNPANSLALRASLPYFLLDYWSTKAPNTNIFKLPSEAIGDFSEINIEDFLLAYDYDKNIGWHGEQFILPDEKYTERCVFAEWGWYFISSYLENLLPKKDNIKVAMFRKSFDYNWQYSDRNFDRVWKERRPTLPFLYIEIFNSNLNWELSPTQEDFPQRLDSLCNDFDGRVSYFRRSCWALDAFRRSYKASNHVPFPRFPNRISPQPVAVRPLPDQLKAALKQGRYEHTLGSLDDVD